MASVRQTVSDVTAKQLYFNDHTQRHALTNTHRHRQKCTDTCTYSLLEQCYYILIKKTLLNAGRDTHIFRHNRMHTNIHMYLYVHPHSYKQLYTQKHTITHSLSLSQGYMVVDSYVFSQRRSIYLCFEVISSLLYLLSSSN